MNDAAAPLPAVVVGGYLGAGKTTLVNHLLRDAAGRRIAVMVNDFGDISIDADLIEGSSGEVLALAGGCVCCSYGADLVGALQALLQRAPRPDVLLIEASGVGLPAAIARTARLVPGVAVEATVVLADCTSLLSRAGDRYVGELVRQQLGEADLVLLNKADLAGAQTLERALSWLSAQGVRAGVIPTVAAAVPSDVVLGLRSGEQDSGPPPLRSLRPPPAERLFETETRHFDGPVDMAQLVAELRVTGSRLVRAKGAVLGMDGVWCEVQVVGPRADIRPWRGPTPPAASRLALIRLRDLPPPAAI